MDTALIQTFEVEFDGHFLDTALIQTFEVLFDDLISIL